MGPLSQIVKRNRIFRPRQQNQRRQLVEYATNFTRLADNSIPAQSGGRKIPADAY
ncbi:hypothetical protein HPP92_004210 [Vanilla planifolia]|uniref:Uncharacterized protein n=1 Tax=Vanilla planifolia TaxID=51239 RepID=A0A835RWG6_VANPL|nr:hypothetical protein HPP92_004210 [Vanilla planifolia]